MDCGTDVDIGGPSMCGGEFRPFPSPPSSDIIVVTGFCEGAGVEVGNKPRISSIAFRGFGGGEAEVTEAGVSEVDVISVADELPKISSSRF